MRLLDPFLGEKFNSLERGKHKLFSTWISLHKSRKESGGSVSRALFRAWQVEKGRGARSGSREMPNGDVQGQGEWVQARDQSCPHHNLPPARLGKNSKTDPMT